MGGFWDEFHYEKKYRFKKNKNVEQIMTQEDFLEFIIAYDNSKENVIIKEYYKGFILEAEGIIETADEEKFKYITYWKGHLKVNTEDKTRAKNLLYPLERIRPWGGWKVKKDDCLTFNCSSYNDLYLYYEEDDGYLHFSYNGVELKNVSYKNYEWVLEELKEIVDEKY
jgi:hypothetical protein